MYFKNARLIRMSILQTIIVTAILMATGISAGALAASLPERISFQNILENKDIAMGEGGALFQDSDGFMWFGGSNALIRYDGYDFRQFYVAASDEKPNEKISVKFTQHIFEDSHHRIWIGTRTGILLFDSNKEQLSRVKDDGEQLVMVTTTDIQRILELPSGEILACSLAGIFIIDPKTLKYTVIAPDEKSDHGLQGKRVNGAYVDKNQDIWFATEVGIEKADWKNKHFTLYKANPENPELVTDNSVADIISDR